MANHAKLQQHCCRFSKGPALVLIDPAPLASHMDNSEEKTCFVPVYFIKGPKVGPLAGSRDVDTPTDLVLLTGFFAQHR